MKDLLKHYRILSISENRDSMTELMQVYTDGHEYEKASYWMEMIEKSEKFSLDNNFKADPDTYKTNSVKTKFDKDTPAKILDCFAGREDMYSIENLNKDSRRHVQEQLSPLTEQKVHEHIHGSMSIGTYIQRPNNTIRFIVADVDVSKKYY